MWCGAVVLSEQGTACPPWPREDVADDPTADEACRSLSLALDPGEVLHSVCAAAPRCAPLHLFYLTERAFWLLHEMSFPPVRWS